MNRTIDLIYHSSHAQQLPKLQPGMAFWAVLAALVYTLGTLWLPHQFSPLRYSDSILSAYGPALPTPTNAVPQSKSFRISDTILPLIADEPYPDPIQALQLESLNSETARAETTTLTNSVSTDSHSADDALLQPTQIVVTPSLATVAERVTILIKNNRFDAAVNLQQQSFTGVHVSRISSIVLEQLLPGDVDLATSWQAMAPGLNSDQKRYWGARIAEAEGKHADVIRTLSSKQTGWLEHPAHHREELALLGAAHLAEGDAMQALTIFRCLTQQKNINSHWYLGLAMAAEQQGERQLAISAYRNALAPDAMSMHSKRFAYNRLNTLLADNND